MSETRSPATVTGRRRGLFLAFEGVEGSGKTTQAARVAAHLRERGVPVIVAREPGTTPLGERVRELVLDSPELSIPARSELFLLLTARAAFVDQVVRPALQEGKVVIADRFELSTLAYQGAGRGLPPEEIVRGNRFATGGLNPDATLLLELDPEEGAHRQEQAAKRKDRMEREGLDFHRRVAAGYLALAGRVEGLVRVDARGSVEEVGERILERLAARFPETFAEPGFSMRSIPSPGKVPGLPGPQAVVEDE
jgi:dTMP kinase